jgi:uncharacterized protein YhaN
MRLTGWHVDAFGVLHDVGVRDLPAGLVVLHGPNASGKSTLLAFLRRTLFGHPHRNVKDVNHYEPTVPGVRRGGRIFVTGAEPQVPAGLTAGAPTLWNPGPEQTSQPSSSREDGPYTVHPRRSGGEHMDAATGGRPTATGETIIERHDGTGLRVIRPDDSVGDPSELDELTGGCDERLFNAVFAFDLDDLRSIDSLTDDAVRDRLFSAGVRGAGRSARTVVERLEQQAQKLWAPRSRTAELDVLQDRVREVGTQLDEARRLAAAYPERRAEERRCRTAVDELDTDLAEAEARERRHETLLAAWPAWQRRDADHRELEQLGDLGDLPDDLLERHERLRTAIESSTEQHDRLEAERDRLTARHADLEIDERLTEIADQVAALEEERTAQRERLDRLDAIETERANLAQQHARALAALGPAWDDQKVAELDVSVEVRGTLRDWQTRFERSRREIEEADRLARQVESEEQRTRLRAERAAEQVETTSAGTPPATQEEIDRQRDRLAALRAALAEADVAQTAMAMARGIREQAGPALPSWAVPALVALIVLIAIGGVLSALAGALAVMVVLTVAALVLAVLAGAVRRARPEEQSTDPRVEAHHRSQHSATDLAILAGELGLTGTPTFEDAEQLAADLDRRQARRSRLDQLIDARVQAETEHRDAHEELERILALRDDSGAVARELTDQWRTWCRGHRLDPELDPATVADLVDAVERVRQSREQLDGVDDEVASLRARVEDFSTRAAAVLGTGSARSNERHAELIEGVRRLSGAVDANRRHLEERDRLSRRLIDVTEELETERSRRAAWARERDDLLLSADALDEASLRTAVERSRRRGELIDRVHQAELDLGDHLGTGGAADDLHRELASGDREGWEAAAEEARQRRVRLRAERDDALAALLEARRRREEVESSQQIADLDRERQALLTRRDDLVHEWRTSRLAVGLVTSTLEGFERERQPGVLRRAGEHFARVTGDEYQGLLQQGERLLLIDAERRTCSVDVLSRGTAEQLYLCLRLALAEDLADRAPQLPFVMDDVLVNFDPQRCRRLAELLAEVAQDHQLLYFTCHPHTVELLEEAGAAAVYDLGPDGAAPRRREGRPQHCAAPRRAGRPPHPRPGP